MKKTWNKEIRPAATHVYSGNILYQHTFKWPAISEFWHNSKKKKKRNSKTKVVILT